MTTSALAVFKPKIDRVFQHFGGLDLVKYLLPEEQILDIANFNGYSFTASPFEFIPFGGGDEEPLPYYLFDMGVLGYQKNVIYNVLDNDWRLVYRGKCTERTYKDEKAFYWGATQKERLLAQNSKHGDRYFISFNSPTGPVLAQLLICQSMGLEFNDRFLTSLESQVAVEKATDINEVFIYFPKDMQGTIRVYSLSSPFGAVTSLQDMLDNKNLLTADYIADDRAAFLRPDENTWLCLEQILADGRKRPVGIQKIEGLDSWQHKIITDPAGNQIMFINAGTANRVAPMSRMLGGLGKPIRTNFLSSTKLKVNIFAQQTTQSNLTLNLSSAGSYLHRFL
jgi:hypothetical protein